MGVDASNICIKHLSESKTWKFKQKSCVCLSHSAKCALSLLHLLHAPYSHPSCGMDVSSFTTPGATWVPVKASTLQEEPQWRLPTAVLDLAGGEAFVAATAAVSTPAGFLFACSLSVFICGLHLVCTSLALLYCWASIFLGWGGREEKKRGSFHRDLRGGMSLEFFQLRNSNDCF